MLDSKLRDRHNFALWKDGRVAEGSGLENRRWETILEFERSEERRVGKECRL